MQCTARADAVHCGSGCSALRGRLQCTASEMGKTGTEIVSPILDKRKGRRDTPHMGHSSPPDLSTEPPKCLDTSIMTVETRVLSDSVLPSSLIQNRTEGFCASFALLRRSALQPLPQCTTTASAVHCIRPCSALHPPGPIWSTLNANTCVRQG